MVIISNKELRIRSFERIHRLIKKGNHPHCPFKDEAVIIPFKEYSAKKDAFLDKVWL